LSRTPSNSGLPTLADPGYEGAGIGIRIPSGTPQTAGTSISIHAPITRSIDRWRTLHHVTASPSKIGDIVRAALVLTHFEHGYIT